MGSLKLAATLLLLGGPVLVSSALAQSAPTYGLGRTPSAEEIRARDINIGATGEELPPGRGTPKEGEKVFTLQGCIVCHGEEGAGGVGPALKSKTSQDLPIWRRERILQLRSHFRTENRIPLFLNMLERMIPNSVQRQTWINMRSPPQGGP